MHSYVDSLISTEKLQHETSFNDTTTHTTINANFNKYNIPMTCLKNNNQKSMSKLSSEKRYNDSVM